MRVLLDEHLPVRLAGALVDHDVLTVRAEGWNGKKNGELLALATDAGFEVLVTNDGSIQHQQHLSELRMGIVMLDAPTNKLEDLLPLVPATLEAISSVARGEVHHIAR